MKSTVVKQIKLFLLIFLICFNSGVFFTSCGLDTVLVFEYSPVLTYKDPLYSSEDPASDYFHFKTTVNQSASIGDSNTYYGVDVYYKIYNNSNDLINQRNRINNVNTQNNVNASSNLMIEEYKFQQLHLSIDKKYQVLCYSPKFDDKVIRIRLKDYYGTVDNEFAAAFSYQDDINSALYYLTNNNTWEINPDKSNLVSPRRCVNKKSFDFFDDDESDEDGKIDVIPLKDDEDYYFNETSSEADTYYVQMFAVCVAYNSNEIKNAYSLVLDLGSIPIRKGQ